MSTQKTIAIVITIAACAAVAVLVGRRGPAGRAVGDGKIISVAERPLTLKAEVADKAIEKADAVVDIEVADQRVELNEQGLRVTVSELRVTQCHSDNCPDTMVLEQLGGEKDGVGLSVAGSTALEVGDKLTIATRAAGSRWRLVGHDRGVLLDLKRADPSTRAELDRRVRAVKSRRPE